MESSMFEFSACLCIVSVALILTDVLYLITWQVDSMKALSNFAH